MSLAAHYSALAPRPHFEGYSWPHLVLGFLSVNHKKLVYNCVMSMNTVRVRFAPSPTGFLHVGGLRTALFNYLCARKNQGAFILRIEDTDRAREVPGSVENIVDTFKIFDLKIDEGPVKQSDRLKIYQEHAQILLDKDAAYKCYCDEKRIEELKKQADLAKVPFRY